MNILERLRRLELDAKRKDVIQYPDDADGFVMALVGDLAEQYRHGSGFDVMAVLNATAAEDWSE